MFRYVSRKVRNPKEEWNLFCTLTQSFPKCEFVESISAPPNFLALFFAASFCRCRRFVWRRCRCLCCLVSQAPSLHLHVAAFAFQGVSGVRRLLWMIQGPYKYMYKRFDHNNKFASWGMYLFPTKVTSTSWLVFPHSPLSRLIIYLMEFVCSYLSKASSLHFQGEVSPHLCGPTMHRNEVEPRHFHRSC